MIIRYKTMQGRMSTGKVLLSILMLNEGNQYKS